MFSGSAVFFIIAEATPVTVLVLLLAAALILFSIMLVP